MLMWVAIAEVILGVHGSVATPWMNVRPPPIPVLLRTAANQLQIVREKDSVLAHALVPATFAVLLRRDHVFHQILVLTFARTVKPLMIMFAQTPVKHVVSQPLHIAAT